MDDDTKKLIQKQFQALPEDIQAAILSVKVNEEIQKIGKKNNLHVDQLEILGTETTLLLLGLITAKEYLQEVSAQLGVPTSLAESIAKDVDLSVLSPVRESVKAIQESLEAADQNTPKEAESTSTQPFEQASTKPAVAVPAPAEGPLPHLRTLPKDIARLKMEESIRLPKEEISMRYKGEEKKGEEQQKKYETDPYRETPK